MARAKAEQSRFPRTRMLGFGGVLAAVALLGALPVAAATTRVLTVASVGASVSSNEGTCPTQIDVGFDLSLYSGPGFTNQGLVPSSVGPTTITIDGMPGTNYGTVEYFRANPPFFYAIVDVADTTIGTHAIWIKGGTNGIAWAGTETTGTTIYGYLASDYTGTFTITKCVPSATPTPKPTPKPTPRPTPLPTARPTQTPTPTPTVRPTPTPITSASLSPSPSPTASPTPSTVPASSSPGAPSTLPSASPLLVIDPAPTGSGPSPVTVVLLGGGMVGLGAVVTLAWRSGIRLRF